MQVIFLNRLRSFHYCVCFWRIHAVSNCTLLTVNEPLIRDECQKKGENQLMQHMQMNQGCTRKDKTRQDQTRPDELRQDLKIIQHGRCRQKSVKISWCNICKWIRGGQGKTRTDKSRQVQTSPDKSRQVQTSPDKPRRAQTSPDELRQDLKIIQHGRCRCTTCWGGPTSVTRSSARAAAGRAPANRCGRWRPPAGPSARPVRRTSRWTSPASAVPTTGRTSASTSVTRTRRCRRRRRRSSSRPASTVVDRVCVCVEQVSQQAFGTSGTTRPFQFDSFFFSPNV